MSNTMQNRVVKLFATSLFASSVAMANITGTVYKDFNLDGQKDGGDAFVSGVTINAVCEDGTTVTTTTDANGAYTLNVATAGNKCRVEANPSNAGVGSGANAQGSAPLVDFVTDGSVHDISVGSPATYCQTSPDVVMATLPGWHSAPEGEDDRIPPTGYGSIFKVEIPPITNPITINDKTTIAQKRTTLAKVEDTGAIWGMAWKKNTKEIFAAAALKRYVPLGAEGAGAIYKIDTQNNANTVIPFVTISNVISNAANTVIGSRDFGFHKDTAILPYIGREGLGDVDISEDETKIYTVNMYKKELVIIDANNGNILNSVPIPNPYANECPAADVRPWALKVRGDDVFIGSVCESKIEAGVGASIQKYNGTVSFLEVARTNTLLYRKPFLYVTAAGANSTDMYYKNWTSFGRAPMLTDLEFNNKGDLILGYTSRLSFNQVQFLNGDVRKMCLNVDGTYTDESTAVAPTSCQSNTVVYGSSATYYEFYRGDEYLNPQGNGHPETASGALAQAPGAPNIIVGMIDGTALHEAGSIGLYSNTTGAKIGAQSVLPSILPPANAVNNKSLDPYGGKMGGMGDIELLCDPAPIEIGNYVWEDLDKDGIQDPNEPAISGVVVNLHEAGTLVGTATTDANGHYYFGGPNNAHMTGANPLKENTAYEIKITLNDAALGGKVPTAQDANTNSEDQRDSDGDNGVIDPLTSTITYTTGSARQNNHNLDFGFKKFEASIHIEKATNTIDADTKAQAVIVDTGDVITWSYVVTNDGNETLSNVVATDDKEGNIECPKTTLAIGESMTCTSKLGEAGTVDYANKASVRAKSEETNKEVTHSDMSHYNIRVEKPVTPTPTNPTTSTYKIGTHFWIDTNANGVFDSSEKPIDGALVELFDATGKKVAETTTANGGEYGFDVPAGTYQVKFHIPNTPEYEGYVFSQPSSNTDNNLNINQANTQGLTQSVTVGPNAKTQDLTLDAGINCGCSNVSSDSADAQSTLTLLAMMLFTLMTAMFFVRREEIEYKNENE